MPTDEPRGAGTRASIVKTIAARPGITEEDLIKEVRKSKGTVRNVLGSLRGKGYLSVHRAPSKGRGPGPLQYSLNLRGRRTVSNILDDIATHTGRAGRRSARNVYVFVRRGTNQAALTKDGRILRVVSSTVEDLEPEAKKQLGKDAMALSLSEFLRTFYPEGHVE